MAQQALNQTEHVPDCNCDLAGDYNDPRCEKKWQTEAEAEFYPCGHQKSGGGVEQHNCR